MNNFFLEPYYLTMATEKITYPWRFLTLTYRKDPRNVTLTGDIKDQFISTNAHVFKFLDDYASEYHCVPEYTDAARIHYHIIYQRKHGSRMKVLAWLSKFKLEQGFFLDVPCKNYVKCMEYILKDLKETNEFFGYDVYKKKVHQ